jgi:hypothetical protein
MSAMNTPTPVARCLLVNGLRHLDGAVIRVFLKLLDKNPRTPVRWALSDDVDAELVLQPTTCPPHVNTHTNAKNLAWVLAKGEAPPADGRPYLSHPLQFEDFVVLLQKCTFSTVPPLSTLTPVQPLPKPAAPKLPEAVPVNGSEVPAWHEIAAASELIGAHRWRLKRWPPSSLLCERPQFRRLASFLSTRYLSVADLVNQSNADWLICMEFVHLMDQHGLLNLQICEAQAPQAAPPDPANKPAEMRTIPNLIERLRLRLGMSSSKPASAEVLTLHKK